MWEELARYSNNYLLRDLQDTLKATSINELQGHEMSKCLAERYRCAKYPHEPGSSTYFDDRAKLAYGWFALPKLMRELDSEDSSVHWAAIKSLSEFLQNPLHCQRAITEMDIVRKTKNAFIRLRKHYYEETHQEILTFLSIYSTIARYLNGAIQIAQRKCLLIEFYKLAAGSGDAQSEKAAEILRNMSEKQEVLALLFADSDNTNSLAKIFITDPCKPYYSQHLWCHLSHFLEWSPQLGIKLGFFDFLYKRIRGRLPLYWDMTMKTFALLLRCAEGQHNFDLIDGVALLRSVLIDLPAEVNHEYLVLAFMNGLHSKRALWRCREFTRLPDNFGRIMKETRNPRLQLYCLRMFRELGVMPCIKRYIVAHWLDDIYLLNCLSIESECARDGIVEWLRGDIND